MGYPRCPVPKDDIRADQKWDFISLNDFKSTSCLTPLAYGYLLVSLVISAAVYAVDIFTAVNLLAFDRWSGEIKPVISFDISKWIFSACIIASLVNLAFEHLRAWHVMRRGAVAESYLDSLAVRLECIRMGENGRGWKRFLVFAELTKSRKGAEFVALFTYFSFQAWIRIIVCQGPQKVINALTLWSVLKANLDPSAKNVGQGFIQFFKNIGILASLDHQQAVILSGMLFTLVIWVFSALSLMLAALFFVFFLWHYIPNSDGGLSGYCERKINTRLAEIVSDKVNKALEEEERKRRKADQKAMRKGEKPAYGRQATLPTLFDAKDDKLPGMPMLNRNDTTPTLPLYTSRPGTPSSALPAFELNELDKNRPYASRQGTGTSYTSNAPLLSNASDMGFDRTASPISPLPPLNTNVMPLAPQRSMTGNSTSSQWNNNSPVGLPRGPPRMTTPLSDRGYTQSPISYSDSRSLQSPPTPVDSYGRPMPRAVGDLRSNTPLGPPTSTGPYRSMTDPASRPPPTDYFSSGPQRSATGLDESAMNGPRGNPNIARIREGPARLASPAPYVNNFNGRGSPQGYNPGGANSPSPPRDPYYR
ncbi:hypothetical protein OIDMADRAFT_101506 [Oidiodendron maius Zn]|uniref:Vacuolar membrane protein n=1 Tax=Oidiodendron maius (strain Zn) TaxID=913774 RepID=A0A0C3CZT9_OIDMZ|nr:hypothetical protein OIDMADRAFT_101506 [Oidiodendron maius Zn]